MMTTFGKKEPALYAMTDEESLHSSDRRWVLRFIFLFLIPNFFLTLSR